MKRLNHPVPMTDTLANDAQQWVSDAILDRTRFLTGVLSGFTGFGIVDALDPSSAVAGGTRPFSVTPSATGYNVRIQGGVAVFGNGELLTIPTIPVFAVPTTNVGERHVLYLSFLEVDQDVDFNEYDVPVGKWSGPPSDPTQLVRCIRKVDYDALPLVTRQSTTIPIALVTPTSTTVVVDHTRSELAESRPWATAMDIEHRSLVGTGVVTDRNAHGNLVQDFAVSGVETLFDFMFPHGIVKAGDVGVAGVPGRICTETIPANSVLDDTDGSITGYVGAKWFRASKFPTLLLSCKDAATGNVDLAAVQIPGKNVFFMLPEDEWTTSMDIALAYAAVDAAAPPAGTDLQTFTCTQPREGETVIAGGIAVPAILGSLNGVSMGPYPFRFQAYVDGDGNIKRTPETLKCDVKLSDAVGSQFVDLQPSIPSKIRIGLRNAAGGAGMVVAITISGTRSDDGASVTEVLTFGSTWTSSALPATSENANQWKTSTTTFSAIASFVVTTRTLDGPDSAITIQALPDVMDPSFVNLLPVANVFWDGLRMTNIQDVRPIRVAATSVRDIGMDSNAVAFGDSTYSRITSTPKAVVGAWAEDFDAPTLVGSTGTSIARWSDGLGVADVYESRPILVRPHLNDAVALRFQPVKPEQGFFAYVRVYTLPGGWGAWLPFSALTSPKYSVGFTAGHRLLKWQIRVQGPCKGFLAAYVAQSDAVPPSLVFDYGAFGADTFG